MSTALYQRAWRDFVTWCRARRLRPLPAHPWTVAAYARWCEPRHRFAALEQRLRAIARAHLLNGFAVPDRHPTVARTLRGIELRDALRGRRAALFTADDPPAPVPALPGEGDRRRAAAATRTMRASPPLVRRRSAPVT